MKILFGLFAIFNLLFAEVSSEPSGEGVYPAVVLGGGIGALTSALYLARAGLAPIVIEGNAPGGLLTQSHTVQNWPGELEIDGTALTDRVKLQAEASGAIFWKEEVIAVDFSRRPFTITIRQLGGSGEEREIRSEVCIIAMGTEPNFLGVPGETGPNGYWGRGITNCAICDGSLYRGQTVGVVGGGDAAVLEALYLSNIAKKVFVFVRKDALRAIEEKRVAVLLSRPNVKILYNTFVQETKGDGQKLTQVLLKTADKEPYSLPLDGLFLAIGSRPNTRLFQNVLKLDEKGFIALQDGQKTSIEGVYALGDIVDPIYKQAISAAGDGAKAALAAQQYLSDRSQGLIANRPKAVPLKEEIPSTSIIEIYSMKQFESELKMSDVPVLVDFYASWCAPCRRLSPLLEISAAQLGGKVKFLKVNVDKLRDLTRSYDIRSMPTLIIIDPSGRILERKVGTEQISSLLKELEANSGSQLQNSDTQKNR